VLVSAATGEGLEALLGAIDARLGVDDTILAVRLAGRHGKVLSWIYENTEVIERAVDDSGDLHLKLRVGNDKRGRLLHQLNLAGGTLSDA
jgi:GTP-binding protein HflX